LLHRSRMFQFFESPSFSSKHLKIISFGKAMAERAGFEPALRSPVNTLSRRAPSTTRPPLRPCTVAPAGFAARVGKVHLPREILTGPSRLPSTRGQPFPASPAVKANRRGAHLVDPKANAKSFHGLLPWMTPALPWRVCRGARMMCTGRAVAIAALDFSAGGLSTGPGFARGIVPIWLRPTSSPPAGRTAGSPISRWRG
jgi:hypothetical protein